ncbi:MAG: hypothetical protein QOD53_120 [Thermoleophilaceae bacterium]|jgi:hypothetical protein|nr:hypothetical protein [Thermoleophilaceae bacterium]
MSETAAPRPLPDPAVDGEDASLRERLGVAAFVMVAVVATATWIALLAWGLIKLVGAL